jgi:CubicO group peptidase (beta-lactamase class C family)
MSAELTIPFVGMVAIVGCSAGSPGPQAWDRDFEVTGVEEVALAPFDTTVMSFMRSHDITGGAVAVTKDGRILFERGYTYRPLEDDITVQPTSLFRIGSASKPITAVAVLRLVEQGRLDLSDRVLDLLDLKARPGDVADPRLGDITIRHLLEHLGGWDRDEAFDPMFRDKEIARTLNKVLPISQQDIITYMNGQELQHDPGTTYAYSNYGYLLLGRVIERVTGVVYETFVIDEVLRPVGAKEMQLGRSLEESRLPNEVTYHAEGGGEVFFPRTLELSRAMVTGIWRIWMHMAGGWLRRET